MSLTTRSTAKELFTLSGWPLTMPSSEITGWNTLAKPSLTASATYAKLGMFGYDMVTLLENCVSADLLLCNILNKFDGWAVGVEIEISRYTSSPYMYGVCFKSNSMCVMTQAGSAPLSTNVGSYYYSTAYYAAGIDAHHPFGYNISTTRC